MKPHRNWFYEYEKLEGGDVLLGDDSPSKIARRGKVWLILKDKRRCTLAGVFHIPSLDRNLIYASRMGDAGV